MNTFRRFVTSLVCVSLVVAPVQQTVAQTGTANLACIWFGDLPAGSAIAVKSNSDTDWTPVYQSNRALVISSQNESVASIRIWKRIPTSDAEKGVDNIITYTVPMGSTTTPESCKSVQNNYVIKHGTNGYYLAAQSVANQQTTQNTETAAKPKSNGVLEAVVAAVVIGGIICVLGGCSGDSGGSSYRSDSDESKRRSDMETQRRIDQNNRAREAAERAEQSRQAAAAIERLSKPNSLGW